MQPLESELSCSRNLSSAGRIVVTKPVQHLVQSRHSAQLRQQIRGGNQVTGLDDCTLGEDLREAGEIQTGQPVAERRRGPASRSRCSRIARSRPSSPISNSILPSSVGSTTARSQVRATAVS